MKRINFKQPKYIMPLIALPFVCLFSYVYSSGSKKPRTVERHGINTTVGDVSEDVKRTDLSDKLDAYRNTYKEADGATAVSPIPKEQTSSASFSNSYSDQQKKTLDSINLAMKTRFTRQSPPVSTEDRAMATALKGLVNRHKDPPAPTAEPKEKDPMDVFKQQMAYMDSMTKANDPAVKADRIKKEALARAQESREKEKVLQVTKAAGNGAGFNTVTPEKNNAFIMAIIDENVTGYAGSRIRLRLLEDVNAGDVLVKKGTYIYALINGYSGQRVTLEIKTIMYGDKLLPVKLDVYDLDGLPGLYVPESAFRDFTKDLGTNTVQGVNIDGGNSTGSSQFIMSSVNKIFESTSSAIAGMIRKNKAKIKYNSCLYLIDNDALQHAITK